MTQALHCQTGDSDRFTKTISGSDIYLFAGRSGDFHDAQINEAAVADAMFGGQIAHGALPVAFISAAGARMSALMQSIIASGCKMCIMDWHDVKRGMVRCLNSTWKTRKILHGIKK